MARVDGLTNAENGRDSQRPRPKGESNFLAMMGNFNIQYNFTSASIAVTVMNQVYKEPTFDKNVMLAIVFIGAMLGMVIMGRLGDLLGRTKAMRVTTALSALGAIVPACAVGTSQVAYGIVALGRLVLGIGVGGIYPLSAVHSAESSASAEGRGNRVSWAFFWQTPGVCVPYFIAMILFATMNSEQSGEWVSHFQFRLLFALGAIPAMLVFVSSLGTDESAEFQSHAVAGSRVGVFQALRREPLETRMTLLGTAGTWFCYDIAFYGTSVFTPDILDHICLSGQKAGDGTCSQTQFQTAWQAVVINAIGIPGCLMAIMLIDKMGSKRLNVYGLLMISVNFVVMAIVYNDYPDSTTLLFVLFCCLTVLLNFGPNLGTFVLPAICFPSHIRSTCHGLSAFGGKLGAVLGSLAFPAISNSSFGLPGVLYVQATICIIGALLSQFLLKHDRHYLSQEDRCATESFACGRSNRE